MTDLDWAGYLSGSERRWVESVRPVHYLPTRRDGAGCLWVAPIVWDQLAGWSQALLADRAHRRSRMVVVGACWLEEAAGVAFPGIRGVDLVVLDPAKLATAVGPYGFTPDNVLCHELGHLDDPDLAGRTPDGRERWAWAAAAAGRGSWTDRAWRRALSQAVTP